jgi:hypothetical protein
LCQQPKVRLLQRAGCYVLCSHLIKCVFVHRIGVSHSVRERSHLALGTLFRLLSTCHALIATCVDLLELCLLHLSLELNLHLLFTFSNILICLSLELLIQLFSNAFTFFICIETLSVILKCFGYLLSLNFLLDFGFLRLVFLYCFFSSHHFELHLFIRRQNTKFD